MAKRSKTYNRLRPFIIEAIGNTRSRGAVSAGGTGGGGSGVSDHGALTGLADDDHTQYLLASGGRTLAGNMAVGSGVTIDGVDISAHAADPDAHHNRVTVSAPLAISTQLVSLTLGDGVETSSSALRVKLPTNSGLVRDSTGIYLSPSTLTVSTSNGVSTSGHTHGITASESPGVASSLLKSGTNGQLTLVNYFASQGVQYTSFTSGFAGAGWRADYGITTAARSSFETDDLTVRGRMRVYELLIQQIRATNGSVFVSSASKVVTVTNTTNPPWTVNGSQLTFNGSNATLSFTHCAISTAAAGDTSRELYHGFLVGDVTRAQQVEWDGADFGGVFQSDLEVTSVTNLYTYGAAFVSGDVPAIGYDYVRLGSTSDTSRQGSVYLTADDSAAPFIDIVDGVAAHSDWNTAGKIKVRVGKLSGISDSDFGGALSGYGLYGNNVYLKGQIVVTGGDLGGLAAADVNANTTTIDGGRITALSVTASQIAAGTITAAKIESGTITTTQLSATAIDGMTITGSTVRTAASGARVVLNSSGLIAYNSSNFSLVTISSSTGALTATSASISGAITATSGSFDGFLTIGTSGGIYQGTGTSGSPTTGIKLWNDSGVGRLAGYNGGTVQFDLSTDGRAYFGANNIRLASDGQRLVLPSSSGLNISTSESAIRWFPALSSTPGAAVDYAGQVAYINTSGGGNVLDGLFTAYVGTTNYTTRSARIGMQAGHFDGSVYTDCYLLIVREPGSGARYGLFSGDHLDIDGALLLKSISTPSPASGECMTYVIGNKYVVQYNDGGTVKYRYMQLASTDANWTYSTTAPS